MKSFLLEIISPEAVIFSGSVYSLVIPLSDGLYGILPDHSPVTAAIAKGKIKYATDDGDTFLDVERGAFTFSDNRAVIVL